MSIGKIAEFKVESDNWRLYVERLEQYFLVNKIPRELQVPTLITVVGADCYELLVNLCTPDKPVNKTFKVLTDILANHLQPTPSVLAERFKFRRRIQMTGETISQYVADLKKMTKTCEFGAWLEESLRDQLVCGLTSETIRQRLFAEVDIDFARAYQLASSMEAAERDAALVENRGVAAATAGGSGSTTAECQAMAGAWQGKGGGRQVRPAKYQGRPQRRRTGRGEATSAGEKPAVATGRGQGSQQSSAYGA